MNEIMGELSRMLLFMMCIGLFSVNGQTISETNDATTKVSLYPNPVIEYLHVKFETPQAKQVKVVLRNILGSEIEVDSEVIDPHELRVKVKDLSSGFYVLLIQNEQSNFKGAYKFLKK